MDGRSFEIGLLADVRSNFIPNVRKVHKVLVV